LNNLIVAAFSSLVSLTSTQQIPALPVDQEHLVDERGYINVFKLRDEVAKVEPFVTLDDTDQCYSEGDPDEVTPSRKEQLRRIDSNQTSIQRPLRPVIPAQAGTRNNGFPPAQE
jgi:hypothetical protein